MENISAKKPQVKTDILPLIQKRWSPRAFSNKLITAKQMEELFEAASWAASAFNEQPWEYVYAHRGTEGFDSLWSCLVPGNQAWAKDAGALFVSIARRTLAKNGKENHWAGHDVGMANAQLLLQAIHRDIYGHLMAGFEKNKLIDLLHLDDNLQPICIGALGYLGDPNMLDEGLKARELHPRSRKAVSEFTRVI